LDVIILGYITIEKRFIRILCQRVH